MVKWIVFFLAFFSLQNSFSQECFILSYGEGNLQKKFIQEIKKIKSSSCLSFKEIKLTGDEIVDRETIYHLTEGIVFCLTDNSAKFCKDLKNQNVIGVFISNEIEYAKKFKVLSFYPNLDKFINILKELNLNKILIIFSDNSSEKAMHIFSKAKEKRIVIEALKVEKAIDVSFKILKVLKDYDAIIVPIDKTYFDKELIEMVSEASHKNGKKVIAFLDLFLDYGADYSFQPEIETIAKEAFNLINRKEDKGIFEITEITFKERGETK